MPLFGDVDKGIDKPKLASFIELRLDRSGTGCETCRIRNLCSGGCYHESYARYGDPNHPTYHYCELMRDWVDFGVETYAGHDQEVAVVCHAEVEAAAMAISQDVEGGFRASGNTDLAAEDIAHTATNNAEGGLAVGDAVDDFIDRAIAADRDDALCSRFQRFTREPSGIAGRLGERFVEREYAPDRIGELGPPLAEPPTLRLRIYDDDGTRVHGGSISTGSDAVLRFRP